MREKIGQMLRKGDIMIFMNGNFDVQMDHKSNTLVKLMSIEKYSFVKDSIATFDLTSDSDIRPAIIEYSKLNDIPQMYILGKLVGGTSEILEMHERGYLM